MDIFTGKKERVKEENKNWLIKEKIRKRVRQELKDQRGKRQMISIKMLLRKRWKMKSTNK